MKIAFCFSGMLRNFEVTFPYFKENILNKHDCDIFLFGYPNKKGIEYCEQKIKSLYSPKEYKLLIYDDSLRKKICINEENFTYKRSETNVANALSQYYCILNCDLLRQQYEKKNNFNYDIVVRTRFDCYYINNLLEFQNLEENTLYIPNKWDFKEVNSYAVSDTFCIADSSTMSKYSNFYNKINMYYNNGCIFHNESLMGWHIVYNNLKRKEINNPPFQFENPSGIDISRHEY